MPRGSDLTGRRFGKLIVLEKLDQTQDRYLLWRCRCDCGGEILVNTKRLTRGTVTDCGCVPRTTARRGPRSEDLTGRRFGLLTVTERAQNENGRTCWLCRCDCGAQCTVAARDLKAGKTTSCGCVQEKKRAEDSAGQRFGRLVALYPTARRDSRGAVIWHCRCDCGTELEVSHNALVQGECRSCGCLRREVQRHLPEKLHRVDGTCVEMLEKRKHRSDNTSGFRGVTRCPNGNYRVGIGFKGKRYYVGTYGSYQQAVAARLKAEQEIHDAFLQAYYRWQAQPEEQRRPLIFEVEKRNGRFCVTTNAPPGPDRPVPAKQDKTA